MESSFHYLLMANQARFQKKFFSLLADTPLTQGQPKVLDYLREHDGAAQKEIAAACQIEPASLTSILNGMEQKPYFHDPGRKAPLRNYPGTVPLAGRAHASGDFFARAAAISGHL